MTGARHGGPPLLYRLLLRLLAPPLVVHLLVRAARDGGPRYVRERLGFGGGREGASRAAGVTSQGTSRPWVHAASVGEVMTVLPLVRAMLDDATVASVLVTTNTPTGADVLARHAPAGVRHRYLPIDWPGATRRFLASERPTSGRIVETEIWPWLYARAKARGVPLAIVNARVSPRTLRHADGPLGPTYRRALDGVDVLARGEADAAGYRALGAEASRTHVVGELKLAGARPPPTRPAALLERPYVLAASTHADEERRLAEAWLDARADGLLVIVPRHPERGAALARELPGCRRALARRSAASGRAVAPGRHARGARRLVRARVRRLRRRIADRARRAQRARARPPRPPDRRRSAHGELRRRDFDLLGARDAIATVGDAGAVARFLGSALDGDAELARQGARVHRALADTGDVVARYVAALDGCRGTAQTATAVSGVRASAADAVDRDS